MSYNYHMSQMAEKEKHSYLVIRDETNADIIIEIEYNTIWERIKACIGLLLGKTIRTDFHFIDESRVESFIESLRTRGLEDKSKVFKVEKILKHAKFPEKSYSSDAGFDLATIEAFDLHPGEVKLIRTGLKIELEPGWEAQVRNRSGIVWRDRCMVALGTGTIDADYRGEIMIPFFNFGKEYVAFRKGDRIAQLVIKKIPNVKLEEGKITKNTKRGTRGYGSTGK